MSLLIINSQAFLKTFKEPIAPILHFSPSRYLCSQSNYMCSADFFSRVIVPVDQTLPFSSTTLFTFAYFGSKMQSKPQVKKKNVLNASYSGEMHKYLNNKHYLLKAA